MRKNSHFLGQPLYGQVIKLLDKSKILQFSRENGGERYKNFPLKYFYGESANAIKIQIWVTLIAKLLLMVMQKRLKRQWSFSGLATMVRITLMYYVDFYSLFNNPEREWEIILSDTSGPPPLPSLFD